MFKNQALPEKLMKLSKAAEILGVTTNTLRAIAKNDPTFPSITQIGSKTFLINVRELNAYIESKREV